MAGRDRFPPPQPAAAYPLKVREVPLTRGIQYPAPNPVLLEDRIAIQHREIHSLIVDNQRLAETHAALKHELAAARDELRHLSAAAAEVKAETDAHVRDVYEKSLKMDAEARAIDAMNAELTKVRADVKKLAATRQELAAELQEINAHLAEAKSDSQKVAAVKAEIETLLQEIKKGRAAIEHEKKTHVINLEQRQAMEKNMMTIAHELDKLHAELANAEKRFRAAAAAAAAANPNPSYAPTYSNPEMAYGGSPHIEPQVIHRVQGGANALPHPAP